MLKETINQFIESKRALGYKFITPSYLLRLFADYADSHGDHYICSKTVINWAAQAPSSHQRRNRLVEVRRMACVIKADDHRHEIPPADTFGKLGARRKLRHIYTIKEVKTLLNAIPSINPNDTFKSTLFCTLFALMYTTGIRFCEVKALDINDLTLDGLHIKATKFHKNRLVPLHPSTRKNLLAYLKQRANYHPDKSIFFISPRGFRLPYSTVHLNFSKALKLSGICKSREDKPKPRIHDLRHTFVINSIKNCQGSYDDIHRNMAVLSTYIGHSQISNTYWYMQATPSLLNTIVLAKEDYYRSENHV